MNILIIEDNTLLAEKIKAVFEKSVLSNRIKIISSYKEFLRELVVIGSYDIILVDIVLSDLNSKTGIDIVSVIRRETSCIPVVIISGLDDISWLEKGFEAGASDYIIKPFRLRELELRIYKWFKIYFYSNKSADCKSLIYEGLEYKLEENEFYYNGIKLILTKSNKYILGVFLSNFDIKLSEFYLIEKIWGDIGFHINRNLRVVISRLKKSLEPYGLDSWVHNIRGEGYILKKD